MNGLGNVSPGSWCEIYVSIEDDKKEDAAIARFRKKLGLPPRIIED